MGQMGKMLAISLVAFVSGAQAWAQVPPHIQAVQEFLLGWGKGDWGAVKAQAGGRVTVKIGGTDYALDPEAKKADAQLVFPFRGLSAVRVEGKVKGVTVEEIAVKAGGAEKKGKGTVTLEEKDGKFTVIGAAIE